MVKHLQRSQNHPPSAELHGFQPATPSGFSCLLDFQNERILLVLTCVRSEAGPMELAHVEVQANDGEHEDGEEEQQANLQQRHHGFHDGLQHHLKA